MKRRSFIGGVVALAITGRALAGDRINDPDFKPMISPQPVDEYTQIDPTGLETFYQDPSEFLWEESSELYGMLFRMKCQMIHYYHQVRDEGYVVPVSGEAYPALILARAGNRNFFIATTENPRSYRNFELLRVQGYYRGGLMFSSSHKTQYDPSFDVTEVDALPLIAATEIGGF